LRTQRGSKTVAILVSIIENPPRTSDEEFAGVSIVVTPFVTTNLDLVTFAGAVACIYIGQLEKGGEGNQVHGEGLTGELNLACEVIRWDSPNNSRPHQDHEHVTRGLTILERWLSR